MIVAVKVWWLLNCFVVFYHLVVVSAKIYLVSVLLVIAWMYITTFLASPSSADKRNDKNAEGVWFPQKSSINIYIIVINRPRSIYQYSNMAPRLSGQTSIFGVVFFVFRSLLGIERQKKLEKFAILTRKPRSHAWILIYRTWPIERYTSRWAGDIN